MTSITTDVHDLQRVVELIVETARPTRVVLFGSSIRGEARRNSDVDVMVVVPDGTNRHATAKSLYLAMARERIGAPVEFHITTPGLLDQHRDDVGCYHFDAVREGRDLYAA